MEVHPYVSPDAKMHVYRSSAASFNSLITKFQITFFPYALFFHLPNAYFRFIRVINKITTRTRVFDIFRLNYYNILLFSLDFLAPKIIIQTRIVVYRSTALSFRTIFKFRGRRSLRNSHVLLFQPIGASTIPYFRTIFPSSVVVLV